MAIAVLPAGGAPPLGGLAGMAEHREREWNSTQQTAPAGRQRIVVRDEEQILFRAKRYNGDELRVTLGAYEGKPVVQVRDWYEAEGGQWRPSKKGISPPVREIAAICSALDRALEQSGRDGRLPARGESDSR